MKKKIFSLLLALAIVCSTMCVLPLTASATNSGTCGENLTWTLDDNGTLTISGTGEMGDSPWNAEKITAVIINDGVTSIRGSAFYGCRSLKSVTIPGSVTSIGALAFLLCSSLKSIEVHTENATYTSIDGVLFSKDKTELLCYPEGKAETDCTIPDGVTSIGNEAFYGCSSLTNVTIPDSVTSIGDSAFLLCSSLKSIEVHTENATYTSIDGVLFSKDKTELLCYPEGKAEIDYTIPDGVTSIGNEALYGCSSLTNVTIPDSVTSIGDSAFYGCSSLTSVSVPSSVTSIGYEAFYGCSSLTGITIPDGVTSISYEAFYDCSSLTSVNIPDSVTSIGGSAFYNCTSLTSVTIPNSVTSIGSSAFGDCTSLTNVTISDSVTSIGDSAFVYCESLTSVTIPNSVTSIGSSAFGGCSSLTNIEVQTENTKYTSTDGIMFNKDKTILLCYPAGKAETKYTIPDSITSIGDSAFHGCLSLTSVTIPDSVTTIGVGAFADCTSLTSVTIPDSVTSIGLFAFIACSSLTSITIPSSVTSIVSGTFFDCSSLTSITIPDSVMKIGNTAFYGCDDLTIKGYTNSYAQTYANKHGIPFESLSCDDNTHIYGDWVIDRAASCTEKGLKHRECEACHEVESADIAALGHDYDTEWTIDTPATETTPGSKSHHCKVCDDKTDIIEIPATGTENVTENYVDVVPGEWYVSAVQYAVDNSLFFGVSDNEFAPNEAMNRAMLVTVLWRLEGKPAVSAENKFTDVPAGEWYTNAVIWASENGVVYGTGNGKFSPEDSITREQMATILYRYAMKKGYDVTASTDLKTFPDSGNASSYARDALSWACGAGLIFGSDGKLLPQDGATRAQVAAILMRYTKKVVQK